MRRLASNSSVVRCAAVAAVVAVALSLAGCGKASDDESEPDAAPSGGGTVATPEAQKAVLDTSVDDSQEVRIAWFVPTLENDYWAGDDKGIRAAADARNASVTTFDAGFDEQTQYGQIQDAIVTNKFDAFIVTPVNATSVVPAIAEAAQAGIKVVCGGGFPCGDDFESTVANAEGVVAQTTIPEAALGDGTGQLIVAACQGKDPCEVAQIPGAMVPAEDALYDALEKAIASSPSIKVVARAEGGYVAGPAQAAAQDMLQAHPDLDVIAASSDAMAAGVELAVQKAGLEDSVKIIGLGGGNRGLDKVRNGTWFGTVVMYPFDEGLYLVDQAVRAVRSQPFEEGINPAEKTSYPPFITTENSGEFDSFTGQWAG